MSKIIPVRPCLILGLLSLLLLLSACSPAVPADDFAYASHGFAASVRGSYTPADGIPRPIAATVSWGEPSSDGEMTHRPVILTFTQPPAMEGVSVTAAWSADGEGNLTRTVTFSHSTPYGEVKTVTSDEELGGFLRFAEALLPRGGITDITPVAADGTHAVTRRTSDGEWEADYLFSDERALPLRVTVRSGQEIIELVVDAVEE